MALDEDDRRVAAHYAALLRRHGPGHRALDWNSPSSQIQRFERFATLGMAPGESVLDVGCGLGDFLPWLRAKNLDLDYTGIDITPDMVAHCRRNQPDGRFLEGNILDDLGGLTPQCVDWVVASGVFAHRKEHPWLYMTAMIQTMTVLARKGVAFNAQSTFAPHPDRWRLYHADPRETEAFCRNLGWTCLLVHDTEGTDFTVTLWRPETTGNDPA
jgi:cyclopropane fatty-acyl-phospholipid synthase-like methyltransferase